MKELQSFPSMIHNALKPVKTQSRYGDIHDFVDIFSGIGGFHLAASGLGLNCVFASDVDDEARRAYRHNFGLMPDGDISLVAAKNIPNHDLLCAGFPCQPFSIIGKREGFSDGRGTLFFEVIRILKAKRPPAIILENVKQLATHNSGQTINKMITSLEGLGYEVDWKVLNALDFGLPQKRERVIIIGLLNGLHAFEWPREKIEMKPLESILEKKPDLQHFVSPRIKQRRRSMHKSKYKPSIWHENKAGNISSHPFSCALRAGASYNYLLVDGERRFTPREMLRLQGFPDSFEIVCNNSQTRKQAGNAVPVPIISAVIRNLIKAACAKTSRKRASA